jgi:hypothetical protein
MPEERLAGSIETFPVVPNRTPAIVVALFQMESEFIVTFEDELEKSKVPDAVVMDAPPTANEVGAHPPSRTALFTLVLSPKVTPCDKLLVELSPFSVIGPLRAKISMKSRYKPWPVELELLPDPIPVIVTPPPRAVARI